jgi:hypothetical protein
VKEFLFTKLKDEISVNLTLINFMKDLKLLKQAISNSFIIIKLFISNLIRST